MDIFLTLFFILFGFFTMVLPIFAGNRKSKQKRCDCCEALMQTPEFFEPEQLTHLLHTIRSNLIFGSLQDITQPAHCPSGEFLKLSSKPPWPDYIEHHFKCMNCQAVIRLAVDTFGVDEHHRIQGSIER